MAARASTAAPAKAKKNNDAAAPLELDYNLAELPSSQHRAGLAGLVLMVDWLRRQNTPDSTKGICELSRLDERGATLRIDRAGLNALFNQVYAATREEQARPQVFKNKNKEIVPPLREEEVRVTDEKTGKTKTKIHYVYPVVIPKGAFLIENDPSAKDGNGAWVKLWRDMTWSILRGVPATRAPFEDRANGEQPDDTEKVWNDLTKPSTHTIDLPSTYFIGAQAVNAENVPFKDRARFQFLLHFWSFVTGIYVPAVVNNEGAREFVGYALAIPDVSELQTFCEELPRVWQHSRGVELAGYRPRDSVVDLAVEGALDMLSKLRERVAAREGESGLRFLVLGVDVIHVEKQGNNIRLLGATRVEPERDTIGRYETLRRSLWNPLFRKQRLLNLVNKREWHAGFDKLLAVLPHKELLAEKEIGFKHFRRDARVTFEEEFGMTTKEGNMTQNIEAATDEAATQTLPPDTSREALVYKIVGTYISRKLKSKHYLSWDAERKTAWDSSKNAPASTDDYQEKKGKIARDAFLAVRSRTGADFVDYFASTLCSVPQYMNEKHFEMLTQALHNDTDEVRTLTMLALSARG